MQTLRYLFLFVLLTIGLSSFAQLREQVVLSEDWRFYKGDLDLSKINSSQWQKITIPHTWNAEDGQSDSKEGYYRGIGIYSKMLTIPFAMENKRIFLRFEGVSNEAEVYLNGKLLGKHEGAFNAFCFEITNLVRRNNNTLIVKASNAPNKNIAPLSGDFTMFGGIYRPVSLIALSPLCITPLDYASSGVYVKQTDVKDKQANFDIITRISNGYSSDENTSVKVTLFNQKNEIVASSEKQLSVGRAQTVDVSQSISLNNPVLWNGLSNPYLYRTYIEIMQGKELVDTLSQFVGLRYFKIDPQKGFLLNGKPYKIYGVNRHQDRQGKGWALTDDDQDQDMDIIREIGANGIRLAHYPHADYFYSLCDRNGLLVWAEIPLVDSLTNTPEFSVNARLQLTELIRQNYNHPSIFYWGLFNELNNGDPEQLITALNTLAHEEDPTRITVAAANVEKRAENYIPDFIACNTYPGWYVSTPDMMDSSLKKWEELSGSKGICVSEYGAGASISQHQQQMKECPEPHGKWHPEEWQAIVHEKNYKCIKEAKSVWGSFIENMFDFACAGCNEGDSPGINDKGLVTYNREVKKDAFFFYKANWSKEPVVYIASRRHVERTEAITDVKVYANCKKLKLKVNGIEKGTVSAKDGIFIWQDVMLNPGKNTITVSGRYNNQDITDECEWNLNSN